MMFEHLLFDFQTALYMQNRQHKLPRGQAKSFFMNRITKIEVGKYLYPLAKPPARTANTPRQFPFAPVAAAAPATA
jgi:hypothetical protein